MNYMVEHTTQEQEDMRESMIAVLEMFAEDDDTTSNSASNDKEVTATPASVETACARANSASAWRKFRWIRKAY